MSDLSLNPNFRYCGSCKWMEFYTGICSNIKSEDYNGYVSDESHACDCHEVKVEDSE